MPLVTNRMLSADLLRIADSSPTHTTGALSHG